MNPRFKYLPFTLILLPIFLTSCSSNVSDKNANANPASSNADANPTSSPTPSPYTLSRADEVDITLDIACDYVRKGFSFEGFDDIDAEVDFEIAAESFREIILDYQVAQQFMDGAIAASREAHRWGNGASLIQGARDGNYIRGRDAEAIIAIYNYCVAANDIENN
jgi:hypothetical protein